MGMSEQETMELDGETVLVEPEEEPFEFKPLPLDKQPLPASTLRHAAPHLRRPFAPNAIRWRVVTGNMLVSYIDARTVIERLNLVVPHLWSTEYEPYGGRADSGHLICHLTIDGVTRSDVGKASQTEGVKGAYSDALKRAAVQFGVGVSLYALKRTFLPKGDGSIREDGQPTLRHVAASGKRRERWELTPQAETWLREQYGRWLETERGSHFGEPLDHGDEPDAVGEEPEAVPTDEAASEDLTLSAKRQALEEFYATVKGKGRQKLPPGRFKSLLDGSTSAEELDALSEKVAEAREAGDE
jgi:hypothetical protein